MSQPCLKQTARQRYAISPFSPTLLAVRYGLSFYLLFFPALKNLLLLTALLAVGQAASAQSLPTNLSNSPQRAAHEFTLQNEELPARNHGSGVRLGTALNQMRGAFNGQGAPKSFELGVFHQRALTRALSWQVEGLYYQQAGGRTRTSGLRLPLLVVVNPFYNLSVQAGPQLQLRTGAPQLTASPEGTAAPAMGPAGSALSVGMVAGAEARVGFLRVGLRYAFPLGHLSNLPELGQEAGTAWNAGQMQLSLGVGF